MPKLTLVSHAICPYVQRAVIALTEKNIAFERIVIDLDAKPAWFLAQSPLGKVPILTVDDVVLFESTVICEYLDETSSPSLHPATPLDRARHRAAMEFSSAMLGDIWGLQTSTDAEGMERAARSLRAKITWLESHLTAGPFFAGDSFHLVDAFFAPVFRYFEVFDPLVDLALWHSVPNVNAWRSALAARPSVRTAVTADYSQRLLAFLRQKNSYLFQRSQQP